MLIDIDVVEFLEIIVLESAKKALNTQLDDILIKLEFAAFGALDAHYRILLLSLSCFIMHCKPLFCSSTTHVLKMLRFPFEV